ncbi:MAG: hypothetical protein IH899_22380 [Planctomycetes bacterium]|nr:hypothetical protein [Planctomycetota bacterium]
MYVGGPVDVGGSRGVRYKRRADAPPAGGQAQHGAKNWRRLHRDDNLSGDDEVESWADQ